MNKFKFIATGQVEKSTRFPLSTPIECKWIIDKYQIDIKSEWLKSIKQERSAVDGQIKLIRLSSTVELVLPLETQQRISYLMSRSNSTSFVINKEKHLIISYEVNEIDFQTFHLTLNLSGICKYV